MNEKSSSESPAVVEVFQSRKTAAAEVVEAWDRLASAFPGNLKDSVVEGEEQVKHHSQSIHQSYETLESEFENPTITIAATGTTSGGKSTLINFLCGEDLMPSGVSEKSAGLVTITHSESASELHIVETEGATWECGVWTEQSPEQLRTRMSMVMEKYRELRQADEEPESPVFELEYPVRIAENAQLLGLPETFSLKLMDLPGLKYIGDKANARVIEASREALCLVTYNSEETDEKKQQQLLDQMIHQVKQLGGSPARMLFILNRIDAFRRDENYEQSANRFANRIETQIRNRLSEQLPEYEDHVEDIEVLRLSAEPALLAHQLLRDESTRNKAASRIDDFYTTLIPNSILLELHRQPEKWEESEYARVRQAVLRESHGKEFEEELKRHVAENLPALVLPHVLAPFERAVSNAVSDADQLIAAQLNRTNDRYESEVARVEQVREDLKEVRRRAREPLKESFQGIKNAIENAETDREMLDGIRHSLQSIHKKAPYDKMRAKNLAPLYSWPDEIGALVTDFLEEIAKSLEDSSGILRGDHFDRLPPETRSALKDARNKLLAADYRDYAGREVSTRSLAEKKTLKKLNQALNDLARAMKPAMEHLIAHQARVEADRIFNSLEQLFGRFVDHLWSESKEVAENVGLAAKPSADLSQVDESLDFSYNFDAGFPISTESRREQVDTKKVKVGEKGIWYTLWIKKKPIYEKRAVYKSRKYDEANIPSLDSLMRTWVRQGKESQPEVVRTFSRWLLEQFETVDGSISQFQTSLLDRYRKRLADAKQAAAEERDDDIELWNDARQRLHQVDDFFADFSRT